ncbi:MAG: hypothetical protein H0V18_11175 [Pyrinomonadaceae bacterium]|nr:hypothetical protein [Pyrinomonadaceae bacterium]
MVRKAFKLGMSELFADSQINREPRWPGLLRLTGASLILHAALLASLLYVPGIRDAFNIAALLANTGYVDQAYSKTEVAEDAQMLSLAHDKFRYPRGYFATEGQLQAVALTPSVPQMTFTPNLSRQLPTPTPTPEASPSLSPEASPAATTVAKAADNSKAADPKTPEEAERELNKIAAENNVVRPNENDINTRPLKDWLARANALRDKGQLDLSSEIEITIAASLNTDCKLTNPNVLQKRGDSRLIDVAKDMVSAIGDSGMLSFLRDPRKVTDPTKLSCDAMPLQVTIKLDQNDIAAKVESQADSPERAVQMAKGYNTLLTVGEFAKRGHDEEILYRNTKVTSEGKQILVNFSMPRPTASEMLKKQLPPSGL